MEGNRIDAPWPTTSSKRIKNSNRTILPTCNVNNKYANDISPHNPCEILYIANTIKQEVDTIANTAEPKR